MKKNILLIGILCISMIMNVSCGKNIHLDNQNTADGNFDVMNQKEITRRLSELREKMTIDKLTELWGQEPEVVNESGNNIYKFHFGDITVTLWGYEIYQAKVQSGGYHYYIDLEPEAIINPEME